MNNAQKKEKSLTCFSKEDETWGIFVSYLLSTFHYFWLLWLMISLMFEKWFLIFSLVLFINLTVRTKSFYLIKDFLLVLIWVNGLNSLYNSKVHLGYYDKHSHTSLCGALEHFMQVPSIESEQRKACNAISNF